MITGVCRWVVVSAGRHLVVDAGADFGDRWPMLAGHVPATACHPGIAGLPPPPSAVCGGQDWATRDLRRWLNAHLHCLHLRYETVTVHAVTVTRAGWAVALLGGHGAGKSLVGLALAARGWQVAAGDLTLVQLRGPGAPVVAGGTSAYLVRADALACFFPDLPLSSPTGDKIDCSGCLPVTGTYPLPLRDAVLVNVGGSGCAEEGLDTHTCATVWYRATGHALDRILAGVAHAEPLRLLESADLVRRRLRLACTLARWLPVRQLRGDPQALAAAITGRAERAG
ncbi:MAG: hypothetical protein ACRDRP_08635 [Pseudonocardiaceae bacterium]